jgi:hypothetical protein
MSAHSTLTPSKDPTQQILWRKRELDYENQLLVKAFSLALFREDCILTETIELEVEFFLKLNSPLKLTKIIFSIAGPCNFHCC